MDATLHLGDCLEYMRGMDANSVDSIVTDPPYGLSFMGKDWDHGVPGVAFWVEALRVAKPGAHLLAFGGTRTFHRLAVAIEDAGWEIRDTVMWVYGSGFPKSHDVSKAIDRLHGAEREVVGASIHSAHRESRGHWGIANSEPDGRFITAPVTPDAERWQGWGTALKPAWEPIIVARKPLIGTVAENVLTWGTGGINVDGCRVGTTEELGRPQGTMPQPMDWGNKSRNGEVFRTQGNSGGRWPANVIHDGSGEVVGLFPQGGGGFGVRGGRAGAIVGDYGMGATMETVGYGDTGSAARFFYCAKAGKRDRDEGLDGMEERGARPLGISQWEGQTNGSGEKMGASSPRRNHHPTVKPTDLMRYLCRLVTPPGGVVLDPFMGSGSTGKGAALEAFGFIGCDLNPEYVEIAQRRIAEAQMQPSLLATERA